MATLAPGIMADLKASTAEQHTRAERHAFQVAMMRGALPQEAYVDYLVQMQAVHLALDEALRDLAQCDERFSALIREFHYQAGYLAEDLAFLAEGATQAAVTPAAQAEAARLLGGVRVDPMQVLGAHYVLEGSKNGAVYIAARLREVYGLNGQGLRYLTAYGPDQRRFWAEFKQAMEELPFDANEQERLIVGASAMFDGIVAIFDDLWVRWQSSVPAGHGAAGDGSPHAEAASAG